MIYSNENPKTPESKLRLTLNRLDACLEMCIRDMQTKHGFQLMCGALNEEFTDLLSELEEKSEKYKTQMPRYREEPLDMDWLKMSKQIRTHVEQLCSHELYEETRKFDFSDFLSGASSDIEAQKENISCEKETAVSMQPIPPEFPKLLTSKLQKVVKLLDEIDDTLNNYTDGKMYADYCRSELDYYDKTGFNSHKRDITKKLNMQKPDKFDKYCKAERKKLIDELCYINEDFADESGIIDHESIGRYIWGKHTNHDDDPMKKDGTPYTITDILRLVKSADHYELRANGTAVRITDANMLKVQEYIAPMVEFTNSKWKVLHQKLWTYLLANKELIPCFAYKLTSRAEFTSFDIPFVHNMICTLQQEYEVYVPFDNGPGHPSKKKVNELLTYEGKGNIGSHRDALGKVIEDENILNLIKEVVAEVQKTSVNC